MREKHRFIAEVCPVDWFLDPAAADAPQRLKEELRGFFGTHSSAGSDVEAAVLAAWELITNVIRH